MSLTEINKSDNKEAQSDCCLSSGEAVNFAQAEPGEVCVDLGSGHGADVFRLAEEVGSDGFVFGLETSDGMIRKAFSNAENSGITNVDFIHSGFEHIRLGNGVADLVISNCAINHIANKQAVWNEIYRILKKGGRFVIRDVYTTNPIADEYRNRTEADCWTRAITRTEYLNLLYNTGFVSVRILEESAPYPKGKANIVSFTIKGEIPAESKPTRCRIN